MAKISQTYGNGYLRAEDFDAKGRTLTIDRVEEERVGSEDEGEDKLVVRFVGEDKGMPLNKTNALSIAALHGDDTIDWAGKAIRVYRDVTMFQGKRVPCMRVAGR